MTERKIIHQDKDRIDSDTQRIKDAANKLSEVTTHYARLNIGELTTDDLFMLINQSEYVRDFIKTKVGQTIKVPAGIDPAQFRKMVQIPPGAEHFMQIISHVGHSFRSLRSVIKRDPRNLFDISGDKVKVKPEALQAITDAHTRYASNETEYQAFQKLNQAVDLFNEVFNMPAGFMATIPGRGCIKIDPGEGYRLDVEAFLGNASYSGMDKIK